MELFGQICWWIAAGLTVLAAPVALWHLLRGLRGLFPMLARPVREERRLRFAVVVCARNEQAVIGSLIDSLMAQRYPRDCFSVFVVADNCTDGTAAEAARHGALVYEREDAQRVGKGCALSWAFDKLREDYGDRFDAAAVFDADNLVDPGFLAAVNDVLCTGADVTQGYRDSTNPDESAVSSCYAVYWLLLMRFFHRARYNSGLPCLVGGTGFAFRWSCIAQNGWHTQTLGEDSEFSLQQILAGRQIVPAYRAVFYDEQPTTWAVSFRQRFRWLVGSVPMHALPARLPESPVSSPKRGRAPPRGRRGYDGVSAGGPGLHAAGGVGSFRPAGHGLHPLRPRGADRLVPGAVRRRLGVHDAAGSADRPARA